MDPLSSQYAYNSVFAFQENKFGKGIELEGLELGDFLKGTLDALMENNIPVSTKYIQNHGSGAYNSGVTTGNVLSLISGTVEVITGLGGVV